MPVLALSSSGGGNDSALTESDHALNPDTKIECLSRRLGEPEVPDPRDQNKVGFGKLSRHFCDFLPCSVTLALPRTMCREQCEQHEKPKSAWNPMAGTKT